MRINALSTFQLLFVFCIALVTGCSSAPQRELSSTVPRYVMLPNGDQPLSGGQKSVVREELLALGKSKVGRQGKMVNILQLSGGGQNGAYGAGFLQGWKEAGTRPKFDVVTGVSTGAIISTFAFLGTDADDKVLQETWLSLSADQIYKKAIVSRFIGGKGSLYDSTPLAKLLEKVITPDVIARVAEAYDDERRLYVATTNLDYNQTWVWDLTAIAKYGGEDALDLYRNAVRASASPPILFEPVNINGSLFVDGGARHNVLIIGLTGTKYMLVEGSDRKIDEQTIIGNTYTIMHHKPKTGGKAVKEDVKDIIASASGVMLSTSNDDSLLRSYFIAKLQDFDFHVTYVPQKLDISEDVLAFDPDQMKLMYETGRNVAKSSEAWSNQPFSTDEMAPWMLEELTKRLDAEF